MVWVEKYSDVRVIFIEILKWIGDRKMAYIILLAGNNGSGLMEMEKMLGQVLCSNGRVSNTYKEEPMKIQKTQANRVISVNRSAEYSIF